MSSNRTPKWSTSASLTKLVSRITRTLSFSSKKNNKIVEQPQSILKNASLAPKSVPVIRRHPPQPIAKILNNDNKMQHNRYRQDIHVNMYDENDDDYSLRPNLSLFNISTDNLHYEQVPRHNDWLENILQSTKIEHY